MPFPLAALAIPVVIGLGAFLSGCGSSSSTDAAAGDGGVSPNASGSAYAPAAPPPSGNGSAVAVLANPVLAPRTAAIDIGTPPADRSRGEALQAWINERAIQGYVDQFNATVRSVTGGVTTENLHGDNYLAGIEGIYQEMIKHYPNNTPMRVRYTIGSTSVEPTVSAPLAVFLDRIAALRPETASAVAEFRRRHSPEPSGTGDRPHAIAPRPVVSGGDGNPRPVGTGSRPRATGGDRNSSAFGL